MLHYISSSPFKRLGQRHQITCTSCYSSAKPRLGIEITYADAVLEFFLRIVVSGCLDQHFLTAAKQIQREEGNNWTASTSRASSIVRDCQSPDHLAEKGHRDNFQRSSPDADDNKPSLTCLQSMSIRRFRPSKDKPTPHAYHPVGQHVAIYADFAGFTFR